MSKHHDQHSLIEPLLEKDAASTGSVSEPRSKHGRDDDTASNRSATSIRVSEVASGQVNGSPQRQPFIPRSSEYLYTKMKYYNSLRTQYRTQSPGMGSNLNYLEPPPHVLPSLLFGLPEDAEKKQSSWQTISSMVNTMMGTTIVALPFGFTQAGIFSGLLIIGVMGAIACFTCTLIIKHGHEFDDFSDFVKHYLGKYWQFAGWVMSLMVILGAAVIYHILMQECLYNIVESLIQHDPDSWIAQNWGRGFAALMIFVVFPLTNLKELGVLVKINSVGFLFVWYTIFFIIFHGCHGIASGNVQAKFFPTLPPDSTPVVGDVLRIAWIGEWSFGPLGGMIMLSYFIHNCIQPITKNADPKTKVRDIMYGYLLCGLLYSIIGVMGYIGFADGEEVAPNFLDSFGTSLSGLDLYALTARISLFCQLISVYPLLLLIIRTQFFGLVLKTQWPGLGKVMLLNLVLMCITYVFAALDVQVSNVTRYTGAIGGLILIFLIPVGVDLTVRKQTGTLTVAAYVLLCAIVCTGFVFLILQFIPSLT